MDTRHIRINEFNYELPDERIAKFPLAERDSSKLLVYNKGEVGEDVFTSLPKYIPQGSLMVFNNTKVIQARLHFKKETGALIEVFCLEPAIPNDYALNFQSTGSCSWYCMIGNLKRWKEGALSRTFNVGGKDFTLTDFAADKRAATPSQAAEIVVADANAYLNSVAELEKRLKNTVLKRLALSETTLERLQNSWALSNPQRMFEGRMQRFDFASVRLEQVFNAAFTQKQHSCGVLAAKLDALSPLTVLARGYSVTENTDGKIIRSIADVRWGDEIVTQVGDGNVISVVQHTEGR